MIIIAIPNEDGRIIWSLSSEAIRFFYTPPFGGVFLCLLLSAGRQYGRQRQARNEPTQVRLVCHSPQAQHFRQGRKPDHHPNHSKGYERRRELEPGQCSLAQPTISENAIDNPRKTAKKRPGNQILQDVG